MSTPAAAVVTPAPPAAPTPAAAPPATPPAAAPAPPAPPAPAVPPADAPPATPPAPSDAVTPPAPPVTPAAPERVVPEHYELAVPANSGLDAGDLEAVRNMAREHKLTQDEAVEALNAYASTLTSQSNAFRQELEADREIGGANLADTQRHVARALDQFVPATTPEGQALRTFLNKSGLGNNLHLARAFARIGKAMGEDTPIGAAGRQPQPTVDIASLLYPTTPRS